VIGQTPRIFHSGLHGDDFYNQLWASVGQTGGWRGEIRNLRKNGEPFVAILSINTIFDQQGAIQGWVGLFSDITKQKETQELVWKQANLQALTGLPNRHRLSALFLDLVTQRDADPLAVLLINLDRFRSVNDTLGAANGDDLLREAARRIVASVPTAEAVSHLDGDEFVVLLAQRLARDELDATAHALLAELAQPYQLGGGTAHLSASIGIALYPQDGRDESSMRKCTNLALNAAKRLGGNTFHYYSHTLQESATRRMRLDTDLRSALANQQLAVHYQPIVHLSSGKIQKAEALVRWQHPTLGFVSPVEFIPVAEASALIIKIGDWVFQQAIMLAAQLRAVHDADFQVSVNVSPVQFRLNREGWQHWAEHLARLKLPGKTVAVEITEGLLMESRDEILNQLLLLRDMGMQVALDDFGTGYSSLAYLQKFDIDYLKIDRAFVQNISSGSSELSLCEAMIVMAHKLGLKVIAEGIETEEQCNMLRSIGCDYGQGFLFSRPIPANDLYELLGRTL
jgi:diguanylate cyclase (GGDEF)-like protein